MDPLRVQIVDNCASFGIGRLLHIDCQMDVGIAEVCCCSQRVEEAGERQRSVVRYHYKADERDVPICYIGVGEGSITQGIEGQDLRFHSWSVRVASHSAFGRSEGERVSIRAIG